jgi:hypothetical protein
LVFGMALELERVTNEYKTKQEARLRKEFPSLSWGTAL